jgi:hypothetical protein
MCTSQLVAAHKSGGDGNETMEEAEVTPATVPLPGWTKREWHCLEQCFTYVRLQASQSLGGDVDPEDINLNDVVDCFVQSHAVGITLDGEWNLYALLSSVASRN